MIRFRWQYGSIFSRQVLSHSKSEHQVTLSKLSFLTRLKLTTHPWLRHSLASYWVDRTYGSYHNDPRNGINYATNLGYRRYTTAVSRMKNNTQSGHPWNLSSTISTLFPKMWTACTTFTRKCLALMISLSSRSPDPMRPVLVAMMERSDLPRMARYRCIWPPRT